DENVLYLPVAFLVGEIDVHAEELAGAMLASLLHGLLLAFIGHELLAHARARVDPEDAFLLHERRIVPFERHQLAAAIQAHHAAVLAGRIPAVFLGGGRDRAGLRAGIGHGAAHAVIHGGAVRTHALAAALLLQEFVACFQDRKST